jgi:hypothetical protein
MSQPSITVGIRMIRSSPLSIRRRTLRLLGVGLAAAGLGAGCATQPVADIPVGTAYQPANIHQAGATLPLSFRRVAVLPVWVPADRGELAAGREALDIVLRTELGRAARFELVWISPADLQHWTDRDSWSAAQDLPPMLVRRLQEQFGCDGALFAEVTHFHAYPPLRVGWNFKLLDFDSARILWAADEIFDAGEPSVVIGARRYHLAHSHQPGPLKDSRGILLSPRRFGHYATETLLATLPGR